MALDPKIPALYEQTVSEMVSEAFPELVESGEAKQKTEKTGDDDALTEETLYECEGAQSG
ncbi:unnamed protein product, partial [Effrenium voratum]